MSATPLSVPMRDPTQRDALARAEPTPPRRRTGPRTVYDPQVRVRRGTEPLTVTLFEAMRTPLRWEAGRDSR